MLLDAGQVCGAELRQEDAWPKRWEPWMRMGMGGKGSGDAAGAGHHSPIGAYDQKSDRVLVMDVARHTAGTGGTDAGV